MNTAPDPRAVMAARNNADWYEAMFRAHGLPYDRSEQAFVAQGATPPYYSEITLQLPNQQAFIDAQMPALRDRAEAFSLKDSFNDLTLSEEDATPLFGAKWVWRAAKPVETVAEWQIISDPADLALWEDIWKRTGSPCEGQVFPPAILDDATVRIFGRRGGAGFDAGCIANVSVDCVGLSNVFAEEPDPALFLHATQMAASVVPRLPLVGYESGDALDWALQAGFETVGDLRILISRPC